MSIPGHIRKGVLIGRLLRHLNIQQLVASNFAKNRENVKGELCFNAINPFSIISIVLSLRDVPKTVFLANQNGGTSSS